MRLFAPLLALLLVLLAPPALAQDDRKAGLFTQARQLPLVSQSLHVSVQGADAEVHLVQVFHNDGDDLSQADYQLHLPEGASLISFGFWQGERFLEAALKEKGQAEADHDRAASEGRATALLKTDAGVQRFSVYPVPAGSMQRVETTFRLPVVREMGRSQVALAVDRFLGQGRADATVLVDLRTDEPLSDLGAEGARPSVLARSERSARLAFSAARPVELWWTERGEPLGLSAEAIALEDGSTAVALRVALNDAGAWRAPYRALHLFVDASFSMRRRRAALAQLVDRLQDQSPVPTTLHAVAEHTRPVPLTGDPEATVRALLSGEAGHSASGEAFVRAMAAQRCGQQGVRCVGITDLQLAGIEAVLPSAASFIFLGDAHERAWMEGRLPQAARVFDPEVESLGKLRAFADELVLPVLEVGRVVQEGATVEPLGQPSRRVAEGGLLRLFLQGRSGSPLELSASIEGQPLVRTVPLTLHAPGSPEGAAVRRGYYERQLATWMAAWKRSPDAELKKLIVDTSLREGIPTAFTALHVASPELSLDAVKPGDPLLTVREEPGLQEVFAWYPFGEARRLARDEREEAWYDRFLVPRGWADRYYAVQVFKRYASGEVRKQLAWYRLDDMGPQVGVSAQAEQGVLRVVPAEGELDVASVRLEAEGGWARTLSPLGGEWMASLAELPRAFTVVVRDRAGNASHLAFTWESGTLHPVRGERVEVAAAPVLEREVPALSMQGRGLRLVGGEVELEVAGQVLRYKHARAPLGSLRLGALLRLDGQTVLFGTEAGELVRLSCSQEGSLCAPQVLARFPHHPVTGLVRLGAERVLVGVLGEGLQELRGEALVRSRLEVGSSFVTGLVFDGRDVLVGTAYNGLWRVVGERAVRSRFPHQEVLGLAVGARGVEVVSGHGRFLQLGRDRYSELPAQALPVGSAATMAAVHYEGAVYVGGFDSGLWRWEAGRLVPVPVALSRREAQVNALAAFGGSLWAGTEAGLLRLSREGEGWRVERLVEGSVHDLAVGPEGLAVAGGRGLWVVEAEGKARRVDVQSGVEVGRFFAVAWLEGTLYAGGMDGLYRFQGGRGVQVGAAEGYRGGWVTALLAHQGRMLVGTYAHGVYAVEGGRAAPVKGLEAQWVPLRALKAAAGAEWVGGLGMPLVRLGEGRSASAVHVPARDVNDMLEVPGGVLLLTSEGPVLLPESGGAQHASRR